MCVSQLLSLLHSAEERSVPDGCSAAGSPALSIFINYQ